MRLPLVCDSCQHLVPAADQDAGPGSCPAFPDGIPFGASHNRWELHETPLPDQTGDVIYQLDPDRQAERDLFDAIRPGLRSTPGGSP